MHFTDIFIKRPVFASALSLMIFLIGTVAMFSMPVQQFPNIQSSNISVTTNYPGASPDLMAGFITTPIENAMSGIDNIDYMYSTSSEGQSVLNIVLDVGADPDVALTNVQSKVTQVQYQFPAAAQNPMIAKSNATSNPTVFIAFQSDTMTQEQITDYLLRVVQPQIQTLSGVSQAPIFGEREYAMRLNMDPGLMAAHNITPNDVFNAMNQQNVQAAAGTIENQTQAFNVYASTDINNEDQFNNMIIAKNNNTFIHMRDVGQALLAAQSYSTYGNVDGKPTITIGVIPTATANPLAVSKEVEALLPVLKKEMPTTLNASITYDSSIFIQVALDEVVKTIIEAVIFVIAIMMLFLGSMRAVMIPLVTIPLSIVGVCGVMLALGYSINTITLLAFVLAVGLVVDDAIVVVENVFRHIEEGSTPYQAALVGTREIGFAVIAMTFTLAAVYAPIGFSAGLTGILFQEFAFTLSAAVIVSGFIALTLSPMMCSKLLKQESSKFTKYVDHQFEKIKVRYDKLIHAVIADYRPYIVAGATVILFLGAYLFTHISSELAPTEDQGVILTYDENPSQASIPYIIKYTNQMQSIYESVPEMAHYILVVGFPTNAGITVLSLKDWNVRKRTAMDIASDLAGRLWAIPGLKIFGFPPMPLPGASFMPIQFILKTSGTNTTERLYAAGLKLQAAAEKYPGFQHVDLDMKLNMPQVNVNVDRNKAADLGIPMQNIAAALASLYGTPEQNQFSMDQRSYWVIPELGSNFDYQSNPEDLMNIYLRGSSGKLIAMSNVVGLTESVVPLSINHFQQLPSITLNGTLAAGYTMGEDLTYLNKFVAEHLPHNLMVDYEGTSRQYYQSAAAMEQAFIFAILFIFLVLAAQFESYRDPLIVMTTVPLSLTGALFTLMMAGGSINIYSEIGLITLVGLISKHGILIVEFANQIQEHTGKSIKEAVIESAGMRLRPILMTTGAMVLAAFPLALATGASSVSRNDLGWVIFGGMMFGTCFSLLVVPTVYTLLASVKVKPQDADELH